MPSRIQRKTSEVQDETLKVGTAATMLGVTTNTIHRRAAQLGIQRVSHGVYRKADILRLAKCIAKRMQPQASPWAAKVELRVKRLEHRVNELETLLGCRILPRTASIEDWEDQDKLVYAIRTMPASVTPDIPLVAAWTTKLLGADSAFLIAVYEELGIQEPWTLMHLTTHSLRQKKPQNPSINAEWYWTRLELAVRVFEAAALAAHNVIHPDSFAPSLFGLRRDVEELTDLYLRAHG